VLLFVARRADGVLGERRNTREEKREVGSTDKPSIFRKDNSKAGRQTILDWDGSEKKPTFGDKFDFLQFAIGATI
jgi:hypothetical protein